MTSQTPRSQWADIVAADPSHSHRYADRFRALAAEGKDIYGEARMIDALLERGSRVLDAGCGAGRTGGHLCAQGHHVVGVDLDPVLIETAKEDYPEGEWSVGDLAELDLGSEFDAIVCAGNVMTFLHPDTRRPVLTAFANHLASPGRAVIGFGRGRGYDFEQFLGDAEQCGLELDVALSTWDLRPFRSDSDFLVAVFGRSAR